MNELTQPDPGSGLTGLPEYEDKSQLAQRLGVSTRTINAMMNRGLPYLKLTAKLTRFPRSAVNQWLASRCINKS